MLMIFKITMLKRYMSYHLIIVLIVFWLSVSNVNLTDVAAENSNDHDNKKENHGKCENKNQKHKFFCFCQHKGKTKVLFLHM